MSFVFLHFCTLPLSTLSISGTFPHGEGNEGRCNLPNIPVKHACQASCSKQCVKRCRGVQRPFPIQLFSIQPCP